MPLFRGKKRWAMPLIAGVLLSSILLTACDGNSPAIWNTHGPVAASESTVFWAILGIATIVFLVVETWLIVAVVKYRERPGMGTPRQIHGNTLVEVIWTAVPTVVLFVVLAITIRGVIEVAPEAQPAGPTVEVEAVGHQWWWEFYYPTYKITTADTMHIPVNSIIHVKLYSNNVIHSFWVPNLTGKTDVVPGHNNTKWFKADNTGKYLGICAEYCGTQHANMRFQVQVDNANDFNTWVTTQQQAATTPQGDSLAAQGAQIFAEQCTTCHGVVGVKGVTGYQDPMVSCNDISKNCLVGPNLTHFRERDWIAGGVLENNWDQCTPGPDLLQKCNLAKWLKDPQSIKPGNDMNVSLTDDQITKLVAYLETLK